MPELPLTDASVYYEILEKNARVINDDIEAVRLKMKKLKIFP